MSRKSLENLPFRDLGEETMIALEEAGHEITVIASFDKTTRRVVGRNYYLNRDALCFLTGRSPSSVDYWINTGKIKPARKHGSYSLFRFEDVHNLLKTGKFPEVSAEVLDALAAPDSAFDPLADTAAEATRRAPKKPKRRTA